MCVCDHSSGTHFNLIDPQTARVQGEDGCLEQKWQFDEAILSEWELSEHETRNTKRKGGYSGAVKLSPKPEDVIPGCFQRNIDRRLLIIKPHDCGRRFAIIRGPSITAEAVFTTAMWMKYTSVDYLPWQTKWMSIGNHACELLPRPVWLTTMRLERFVTVQDIDEGKWNNTQITHCILWIWLWQIQWLHCDVLKVRC